MPKPTVAQKGTQKVRHERSSGNKTQITILGCANAAGQQDRKNKVHARVLTSVESRTLLEEKERQKREAETKEQRKQERLAKKAEKDKEKK